MEDSMMETKFDVGMPVRKATMKDVAKMAGVALSTVSHVINGTASIGYETQMRVLDAISQLNYSPNALARALRQNRSRLVGVVVQDISSEFYARCAASLLVEAQKVDHVVLLVDSQFDSRITETSINALIERRVDGLIFIGGHDDNHIIDQARRAGVAVVLGDRHLDDYPCVEFDNLNTVHKLVCALYQAGYRRFGYAGEPVHIQNNLVLRYEGFLQGLKTCNIPDKQKTVLLDTSLHQVKIQSSYKLFSRYFERTPAEKRPEVIITSNDMIAQGAISAAVHHNIRVPEDLAVFGFDDIYTAAFYQPAISTVQQDCDLLGQRCFSLLLDLLDGRIKNKHEMLPQRIVSRESAVIPTDILERFQ